MPTLWKVYSRTQYFYKLAYEIGEAHIAGRETFGPGVSFSVREATLDELSEWLAASEEHNPRSHNV